jgi:ABC-type dipeptide/oligopeptide/nickel transport system permease component
VRNRRSLALSGLAAGLTPLAAACGSNQASGGYVPLTQDPAGWAQHLLLPWVTLALVTAATYSRLTRGSMLEVLGEDYIRTARSTGLSEGQVVYRHGLRSTLIPVVTQLGVDLGTLLGVDLGYALLDPRVRPS